jgi:hypothetical protein
MKIDRRLNLVLSVTRDDGTEVWVHHTPIRREIYEQHFLVLTKTMAAMYEQSLPPTMSARIALLMIRKVADELDVRQQVETTLLPEIWRMTMVLVPSQPQLVNGGSIGGWQPLPLEKVMQEKIISEEDAEEVKNYVCFFTAASWIHRKSELDEIVYPMLTRSGSQIVSSNSTDFMASLQTSTPAASTGAMATPSSIPS